MKRLLIATLLGCLLLVGCGSNENEVTQENNVVETTNEVVEDTTTLESESETIVEDTTIENEVVEETTPIESESEVVEETPPSEDTTPSEDTIPSEETTPNESSSSESSIPPIPIFDDGTKDDIDWNQYSSGNGDDLSFSGSLTLPSGLTISTLNKFNKCGMSNEDGNSWMGDIYSDIVAQNYEIMATNFDNFNNMYNGSDIHIMNGEQIWWRSSMADMSPSIELRKSSDYNQYNLIISAPLLDDTTAESLGWMSGRENEAREALTVLLSTICSNPQDVQNALILSLYEAPNGEEPISIDGSWATIGDCQVRLNAWDTNNGNYIFVFNIRGN